MTAHKTCTCILPDRRRPGDRECADCHGAIYEPEPRPNVLEPDYRLEKPAVQREEPE